MARTKFKGRLITFEGIDGCGKSTQLKLAARHLRRLGHDVCILREPGSTKVSERIRRILLDRSAEMSDLTELLLYEAARAEIVAAEIRPALKNGRIVLCDRFYDSTTAYQGYGRKLDLKMVRSLHQVAVGDVHPDLTFVFDVDLKTAFARRGRKLDRLEAQSLAFHRRVRIGFKQIARKEPRRVKLIDGRGDPAAIAAEVLKHLLPRTKRS